MLTVNTFNLEHSKILSYGVGLIQSGSYNVTYLLTLSQTTNFKLEEFTDDNFILDENGRQFFKWVENTVGKKVKLLVTSNSSFFHSVFKRLVLQTCKNQGLFGKGLKDSEQC